MEEIHKREVEAGRTGDEAVQGATPGGHRQANLRLISACRKARLRPPTALAFLPRMLRANCVLWLAARPPRDAELAVAVARATAGEVAAPQGRRGLPRPGGR